MKGAAPSHHGQDPWPHGINAGAGEEVAFKDLPRQGLHVAGDHPTKTQAKAAFSSLPHDLRGVGKKTKLGWDKLQAGETARAKVEKWVYGKF